MKWNHILNKQPKLGSVCIQVHYPDENWYENDDDFKRHYTMGMVQFKTDDWNAYFNFMIENNAPLPNFYWIYAKDFPFPEWNNYEEQIQKIKREFDLTEKCIKNNKDIYE